MRAAREADGELSGVEEIPSGKEDPPYFASPASGWPWKAA
jgi:hypothetical protein